MVQEPVTEEIGLRRRNVTSVEGPKSLLYEQDGPDGGLGATIAISPNASGASDIDDRTEYRGMARQWVCTKRSLLLVETGGFNPLSRQGSIAMSDLLHSYRAVPGPPPPQTAFDLATVERLKAFLSALEGLSIRGSRAEKSGSRF